MSAYSTTLSLSKPVIVNYKGIQDEFLDLVEAYNEESEHDLTFDRCATYDSMCGYITSEDAEIILLLVGHHVVGFAIYTVESIWTHEELGNIFMFYIAPAYRNNQHSKELMARLIYEFKCRSLTKVFASSITNAGERCARSYATFLLRSGFKPAGHAFMWEAE